MAKGSYIHKIMTWCIFPIVVERVKLSQTRTPDWKIRVPLKPKKPKLDDFI